MKTSTHKSLFEQALTDMDIIVAIPRHNGKVERQHRTDEKRFYNKMKMYNLEDGRRQLAKYNQNQIKYLRYAYSFVLQIKF